MHPIALERRRYERLPLRLTALVSTPESPDVTQTVTENISGEGLYFASPRRLAAGQQLEVSVELPMDDYSNNRLTVHLRCKSEVVRVDSARQGCGFGIACRIQSYSIQFGKGDFQYELLSRNAKA